MGAWYYPPPQPLFQKKTLRTVWQERGRARAGKGRGQSRTEAVPAGNIVWTRGALRRSLECALRPVSFLHGTRQHSTRPPRQAEYGRSEDLNAGNKRLGGDR